MVNPAFRTTQSSRIVTAVVTGVSKRWKGRSRLETREGEAELGRQREIGETSGGKGGEATLELRLSVKEKRSTFDHQKSL